VLNDEIRKAREALGMSQRKLADLSGVPRSLLSNFEQHGTNITLDSLRKLVTVLPNVEALSLGVRDVKLLAGTNAVPMDEVLDALRRATDMVESLAAAQPRPREAVGATEIREGGTEVSPAHARVLARESAKARSRRSIVVKPPKL
jgi:XRE family transcriptional regulator, regulator of sulfur utilization